MTSAQYAEQRGITACALAHERKRGGGPPWFWWNSVTKKRVLYYKDDVSKWIDGKIQRADLDGQQR